MSEGLLTIDLDAVVANWRALDALSDATVETAAVVKANGYGLGAAQVGTALAKAGARRFFVALASEGATLRAALGEGPDICVFSGHMAGDMDAIRDAGLTPMLNSPEQVARHRDALPGHAFGIQLDSGMNRLGMEPDDWASTRGHLPGDPVLVMSHLACADEPDHPMNRQQLDAFRAMTDGIGTPRSLSATGGILLGQDYHFDMTRPGVGLYGGLPFEDAKPTIRLSLPVVQIRELKAGETVGYGNRWVAKRQSRIATLSAGYADGLIRSLSNRATLYANEVPCALVGRVSMDLLTVDVTDLTDIPDTLDLICPAQTIDELADQAGTIGYEILTSLGARYTRRYLGGI